jgi:type IV pilus assembly protein PilM
MKSKRFIGVDIGTAGIKAAEIEVSGNRPEILSLRECAVDPTSDNEMSAALEELVPRGTDGVVTGLGGENVVCRIVQFPLMKKKELDAAVRYEMERFVPSPEKVITRYVFLNTEQPGQRQELLLLAAREDTVCRYYRLFSGARLSLTAIDYTAFALWRLFGRKSEDSRMILDLGAEFTTIILVNKGVIRLIRILPAGEELFDASCVLDPERSAAQQRTAVEIQRSLSYYSQQEKAAVEKVIITGGAIKMDSKMEGLLDYFQGVFQMPVELGVVPPLLQEMVQDVDHAYAVAVGLALREVI